VSVDKPDLDATLTVLITGGSVGFGLALAEQFVAHRYSVFVCARTEADLDRAARDVPGLMTIVADVADPADQQRLFAEIESRGKFVDVLVNNAALTRAHDYTNDLTLASDRARQEIEVNFAAPIELGRLFLSARRRAGRDHLPGALVNIGTPGALIPLEAQPLYCATKAGLHMFTVTLRRQLRESPVHVIEVFPPGLPTGLARELDVAGNSADISVVAEVAAETFAGIVDGTEVILPHEQSRRLYTAMPEIDPDFIDRVNSGVRRRAGWDQA
jgi:uncharacterized oxidoreductase